MIFNKDVLVCPCCGDSYLHHDSRQEDAETITKTVVANNGMAAISRVHNADSGIQACAGMELRSDFGVNTAGQFPD